MTQENKDLLLKYLCMALPYGVCAELPNHHLVEHVYKIEKINMRNGWTEGILDCAGKQRIFSAKIEDIKPYLRPKSSMTDEEDDTYRNLLGYEPTDFPNSEESLDFALKKHVDFLGLIPMGSAIEVTNENNPYKS